MDTQQLNEWKVNLEAEIAALESKVRPALEKLEAQKEKLALINRLLSLNGQKPDPAGSGELRESRAEVTPNPKKPIFTPTSAYWVPLLESLVELGGRAQGESVVDLVGKKMKDVLTPADYETLPNSSEMRWRNRTNWQRFNMVRRGLLRSDSPRGIWEISDAGRRWLREKTAK